MNTIGPIWTALIIRKKVKKIPPFENLRDTLVFLLYGVIIMAAMTATGGIFCKWLSGAISVSAIPPVWIKWWLAHASGALLFSPVIIGWLCDRRIISGKEIFKFAIISVITIIFTILLFFFLKRDFLPFEDMPFILIIPMACISIYYSIRETMTIFSIIVITSMIGTVMGYANPFGQMPFVSFGFMSVSFSLTLLILCAMTQERRDAEKDLRRSIATSRTLLKIPVSVVFLLDRNGICIDVNETVEKRFKKEETSNIIGKSVFEFFTPQVAANRKFHFEQALRDKKMIRFEDEHRGIWNDIVVSPVLDENGEVSNVVVFGFDITERKNAEKALLEAEARFRTLFEKSHDAYLLLSNGVFTDCNEATVNMLKGKREQIIGVSPDKLSPEFQPGGNSSRESALMHIQKTLTSGTNKFEWLHRRFDGTDFWTEVTSTSLFIHGEPVNFVTWRDITERKYREEEIQKTSDRILAQNQILSRLTISPAIVKGEVEKFSQELTELVSISLGIERVSVWLLDENETKLICIDLYEKTPQLHSSGMVLVMEEFHNELDYLKVSKYLDVSLFSSSCRIKVN